MQLLFFIVTLPNGRDTNKEFSSCRPCPEDSYLLFPLLSLLYL